MGMANKLYAMEQLTEEVAKTSQQSRKSGCVFWIPHPGYINTPLMNSS